MSWELVNRISIKKDGVYMSTHSNNDDSNYHSVKIERLSNAYKLGQRELDKEIIDMYFDFIEFRGNHKSILPYKNVLTKCLCNKEILDIYNKQREIEDKIFDIANGFGEFKEIEKNKRDKMCANLKMNTLAKIKEQRNSILVDKIEEERKFLNSL